MVDKSYVDSVATGLNVHASVCAATTANITLSGNQTIDGFMTSTGNRILVKNQISGASNGIYSANTGAWGRTSDYDNIPLGQVTNGDLIPVYTGNTQNSSIWVLTTPDPITLGVTPLMYSEFSTIIDLQAGQGIAVTQVGGLHTICVLLPTNTTIGCGLIVSNSGLCINPSIAGNGLSWCTAGNGCISVNANNCGSVSAIPVGYNAGNCLIVARNDLKNAINAITGATNGLTSISCVVKLGGNLCCNTTITIPSTGSTSLTFTDNRVGNAAVGIQYGGNYDNNFTARSIVDAGYVTGLTNNIKTQINYYTGTTVPNTYYNKTQINYYTGTTVPNTYYNKTCINSYTGKTAISSTTNEIIFNKAGTLTGNTKLLYCYSIDALQVNCNSCALGHNSVAMASGTKKSFAQSFPLGTVRLMEKFPHAIRRPPRNSMSARDWVNNLFQAEIWPLLEPALSHEKRPARSNSLAPAAQRASSRASRKRLDRFDRDKIEQTVLRFEQVVAHRKNLWRLPLAERKEVPCPARSCARM